MRLGEMKKFTYNVGSGTYQNPENPAIAKILRQSPMKRLVQDQARLAQELFRAMARRNKDASRKGHKANADSTRLSAARIWAVQQGKGRLRGAPDRYMVDMENYGRWALKEEFGRVRERAAGGVKREGLTHNYGEYPRATVRDRAQHVLNGAPRGAMGVIQILEAASKKGF